MKKRSILFASTVAAMALQGPAAHAERGSDGELKILFWQAVSTLNPTSQRHERNLQLLRGYRAARTLR